MGVNKQKKKRTPEQDLKKIFESAWCPLFGKIPEVREPSEQVRQLTQIIKDIRKILWKVDDKISSSVTSSWPERSGIDKYPYDLVNVARHIYGAFSCWKYDANLADEWQYQLYYGIEKSYNPTVDYYMEKVGTIHSDLKKKDSLFPVVPNEAIVGIFAIKLSWDALQDIIAMKTWNDDSDLLQKIFVASTLCHKAIQSSYKPFLDGFARVLEGGDIGRKKPRKNLLIQAAHQREAEEIWREESHLSKSAVAKLIAKRTGKKWHTIRQYIVQPEKSNPA